MRPGPEMLAVAGAPRPGASACVGCGLLEASPTLSWASTVEMFVAEVTFMDSFLFALFERRHVERHSPAIVDALFTCPQHFFNSGLRGRTPTHRQRNRVPRFSRARSPSRKPS